MSGEQSPEALRNPALDRVSDMNLDGASDRPRGSAAGSQAGSHRGSQPGSPSKSAPRTSGFTAAPLGYDPAREKPRAVDIVGKRIDLPADAYLTSKSTRFTSRPGWNSEGKPIQVQLNVFPATFQDKLIYQYSVAISPEPKKESTALMKKLWNSPSVRAEMKKHKGVQWLFDGMALAWSTGPITNNEFRTTIDLDADKEKKRAGSSNVFYLTCRQTTTIQLHYLKKYIDGEIGWDTHVLECMNLVDHCMRQGPSERMIKIRRNFYPTNSQASALGRVVEVHKGYYAAARLAQGNVMMINVDTANTAFWQQKNVAEIAWRMFQEHKSEWSNKTMEDYVQALKPVPQNLRQGGAVPAQSEAFGLLKRLQKLKFHVKHRGKMGDEKMYTVKRFIFEEKYGREGAHAQNVEFGKKMPDGSIKNVTVWQHYLEAREIRLRLPGLPIIESTRGGLFPMELCNVADFQRYPFKLDSAQTTAMIKFAVTRPGQRKADIMQGMQYLNYGKDENLNAFKINVSPNMKVTNARLLRNPKIAFAGDQQHDPGTSGRWDLRGKRFLEPNRFPIKSWGFVVCGNACTKQEAENFASKFTQGYRNHGAKIEAQLACIQLSFGVGDYGEICLRAWNDIGAKFKSFPQMLFFVVPNKNAIVYERIKKSMDCRFACPSQVLQSGHVKKANGQYISNVAMKVNAKLGGVTCKIAAPGQKPPFFTEATMMIGVDVSHGAPGSNAPSMAAMTVSMDKYATRYAAQCETNGLREEILQSTTCHNIFPMLLSEWQKTHNTSPRHVYYLRDGCAEGQFQAVIETELNEIRRCFKESGAKQPKFTVIIATKRHHVRFFPKPNDSSTGDRNGNPLPGTLVERDATHPHHFDFYLCSHVAIQGTARPVHYQVIYDEANVAPDLLQRMIYQQCYQYARSTTPVSLHPAVYYAHVASNRAKSHESIHSSQKENIRGKEGHPTAKSGSDVYASQANLSEPPQLIPMKGDNIPDDRVMFMNTTMWFM
ncbi:Piwi domain-containing protein [Astrocystis sublimbata]|nr:Piwi domain-containing protein [Astrocystis sublimbata]